MTNKEALEILKEILFMTGYKEVPDIRGQEALNLAIKVLEEQPTGDWIPVTTRPCDDEEFEDMKKLFGEDIDRDDFPFFDCPMPDDGQEILITTVWGVDKDTCEYDPDYGYTLEGRGDWEDVTAWMPSPESYKGGGSE